MPVEVAVLQIANSLLVPIWKLTNTCFIALSHAKSVFLPTQRKSGAYIIFPGYSKRPEAEVYTVCIWHSESDAEVNSVTFWDNIQIFQNNFFCSSSCLHSLVCTVSLNVCLCYAFALYLPFGILFQENKLMYLVALLLKGVCFTLKGLKRQIKLGGMYFIFLFLPFLFFNINYIGHIYNSILVSVWYQSEIFY